MTTLWKGWAGTDLGPYRGCDGTYCFFEEQSLPPLPELDGSYSWLPTGTQPGFSAVDSSRGLAGAVSDPALPPSFVAFFGRPELASAVPSCTACYWSSAGPIPSPLGEGTRLVRFLSDQQDILHWYVELPSGRVVCGGRPYGEVELTPEEAARDMFEAAPSFEAFLYRFWVENVAWFELQAGGELTPAVRSYLSAYPPPG